MLPTYIHMCIHICYALAEAATTYNVQLILITTKHLIFKPYVATFEHIDFLFIIICFFLLLYFFVFCFFVLEFRGTYIFGWGRVLCVNKFSNVYLFVAFTLTLFALCFVIVVAARTANVDAGDAAASVVISR